MDDNYSWGWEMLFFLNLLLFCLIDDLNYNILTLHVIFRKGNVNQPEAELFGIQQSQFDTYDVLDSFTKCVDTPRTQNSLKL